MNNIKKYYKIKLKKIKIIKIIQFFCNRKYNNWKDKVA